MEKAFKSSDDCVGELVNWIQDDTSDEHERRQLTKHVFANEKKWSVVCRGTSQGLDLHPQERTVQKNQIPCVHLTDTDVMINFVF